MKEAGRKNSELAKKYGEVDKDGIQVITVVADGTSPDAIIQGENAIIEVKYPYIASQLTPQAAILAKKD
ncbi:hypothetical protein ILUMI_17223 [Ignelater luminosus]|uniref:YqaJ viral recombinase domain-containing protein n=1 Tax=Ignelater luminosus TaxID=2038154 RepID=A0A8K0CKH6_IGNLU|nr:hypothetical protein ILUMI_17223 [Ignelater luminosus]